MNRTQNKENLPGISNFFTKMCSIVFVICILVKYHITHKTKNMYILSMYYII